jgi:hypothetical protein
MEWLTALALLLAPPPATAGWDLGAKSGTLSVSGSVSAGHPVFLTCNWYARPLAPPRKVTSPLAVNLYFVVQKEGAAQAVNFDTASVSINAGTYSTDVTWTDGRTYKSNLYDVGKHTFRCGIGLQGEKMYDSVGAGEVNFVSGRSAVPHQALGSDVVQHTLFGDPNIRACKGLIYANVQLDAAQFAANEPKPESSPAKISLDLVGSHALGDYVHCEYQNVGKDVKIVYTYKCPGATPTGKASDTYRCQ